MRQGFVNTIVYFYIFVCIALLVFNIIYIFNSKRRSKYSKRQIDVMGTLQKKWMSEAEKEAGLPEEEKRAIVKKLRKISWLLAFQEVLLKAEKEQSSGEMACFFRYISPVIYELAMYYQKRPVVEKSFFAYFSSVHLAVAPKSYERLGETFLLYLENSTVYCRENVLHALYALGAEDALERAFEQFQVKGWYHQPKLISDGMAGFQGDKEKLVRRLWTKNKKWPDFINISLVQFMANQPEDFSDIMLPALKESPRELRFVVIRYFQRHPKEAAKEILLNILNQNEDLAIAAASALEKYPGEDTEAALKKGLQSTNWYVRHNAAVSLLKLGISESEKAELLSNKDKYAREMFAYVLESENRRQK